MISIRVLCEFIRKRIQEVCDGFHICQVFTVLVHIDKDLVHLNYKLWTDNYTVISCKKKKIIQVKKLGYLLRKN